MHQIISKRLLIYTAFLFVLDITFSPYISFDIAKISFLSLLVLYVAYDWGWSKTLPVAIMVGLLKDLYGSPFLGMETFSLAATVIFFELTMRKLDKKSWLVRLPMVFLFILIYQVINYLLTVISGSISQFSSYQIFVILATGLYHAVFFPAFFKISAKIFSEQRRVHQYELFN